MPLNDALSQRRLRRSGIRTAWTCAARAPRLVAAVQRHGDVQGLLVRDQPAHDGVDWRTGLTVSLTPASSSKASSAALPARHRAPGPGKAAGLGTSRTRTRTASTRASRADAERECRRRRPAPASSAGTAPAYATRARKPAPKPKKAREPSGFRAFLRPESDERLATRGLPKMRYIFADSVCLAFYGFIEELRVRLDGLPCFKVPLEPVYVLFATEVPAPGPVRDDPVSVMSLTVHCRSTFVMPIQCVCAV